MTCEEYAVVEREENDGLKRFEVILSKSMHDVSCGLLRAYYCLPKFGHILLMEYKPNKERLESDLGLIHGISHDVEEANDLNYQKAKGFAEEKTSERIEEIKFVDKTSFMRDD